MLPNRFRYLGNPQHAAALIKKSKTSSEPVAPEYRTLALEWLERQAAIVDAVSALGSIDPDYFKVGRV